MLVKEPSFSAASAAGRRKTSVLMSCGRTLAAAHLRRVVPEGGRLDLEEVAHDQPVEVRRAPAAPGTAFWPPTAGFWPMQNRPLITPSRIISIIAWNEWSPAIFGSRS